MKYQSMADGVQAGHMGMIYQKHCDLYIACCREQVATDESTDE